MTTTTLLFLLLPVTAGLAAWLGAFMTRKQTAEMNDTVVAVRPALLPVRTPFKSDERHVITNALQGMVANYDCLRSEIDTARHIMTTEQELALDELLKRPKLVVTWNVEGLAGEISVLLPILPYAMDVKFVQLLYHCSPEIASEALEIARAQ